MIELKDFLGETLLCKGGPGGSIKTVPTADLQGKHVCLYYSAHWCPPCKAFTPVLRKFYEVCKSKGWPVEIVFVSGDNDEADFNGYYGDAMPWLAVPFKDESVRMRLMRRYNVLGIPCLVILGPEGQILNKNARSALLKDPEGKKFPWVGLEDTTGSGGMIIPLVIIIILVLAYFLVIKRAE